MKQKISMIVSIVLCAVLLPFAAISATLAIKGYINQDTMPTVLGIGPVAVIQGSMHPAIRINDLVLVKVLSPEQAANLEVRQVIAFYNVKGVLVTHRIVGIDTDENGARLYITKGDANNVHDRDPVRVEKVAGRIVGVIPGGGGIMRFVSQPVVTAVLFALPLGVYYGGRALMKTLEARRKKTTEEEATPDIDATEEPAELEEPAEPEELEEPEEPEELGDTQI